MNQWPEKYDVIVVGAGHAGSEAAAAAAKMGSRVLLITMDMTKIAQMSCNPAMGGIAKGQIIREIDAMGGYSGIVTDRSMIQFRMLNRSKGPAMWSPRAQCDRSLFSLKWREVLESIRNIDFFQDRVTALLLEKEILKGVITRNGIKFSAKSVILTTGTFEKGLMHIGKSRQEGGRAGEPSSAGISDQLKNMGFEVERMKTGTPARVDGRSIDFSKMEVQHGDNEMRKFSYLDYNVDYSHHLPCYITYTNDEVHAELEKGFKDSPLFDGTIKSIGPRYCPSIEDKVVTFSERNRHQLFLEPEGLHTVEYYINGFSSSLPWEIQHKALKNIPGLEEAKIFRTGYAIEYDYYPPTQLYHSLETKKIKGLYFAGQINGTTGYEEAGAQGMIAAINAHRKINDLDVFVLKRDQAYMGVLVDDLVTKGVDEPYRMFTSRAEYRLMLRQDDADERLTEISHSIGLAEKERVGLLRRKRKIRENIMKQLGEKSIAPDEINSFLIKHKTSPLKQKVKIIELIRRPQVQLDRLMEKKSEIIDVPELSEERKIEILESTEIIIKYQGYIERERGLAEKIKRLEQVIIRDDFDYDRINSLSTEARQKLSRIKPRTIGQASRISGVSPADVSMLLVFLGR